MEDLWVVIKSPVIIVGLVLGALLFFYILLRRCRVYVYINSNEFGVIDIVPQISVTGTGSGGSGSIVEAMAAMLMQSMNKENARQDHVP